MNMLTRNGKAGATTFTIGNGSQRESIAQEQMNRVHE